MADQIARDLGFDSAARERRRDGRREERSRGRDSRSDSPRRNSGFGYDSPDDVGRFQFDTEIRERPRGRAGEALRQNQLEHLLVHETAAADGGLTKPYLGSLPDAYAAERLVFDWLEFLVLKGGYKRTMDALRYYHTVEWLTEDVEAELQDYLVGFSGEVSETTDYDVDDHHLSLVYIARLASMT
ncbi:FlaD/FlaE family flagellar protein [Halobellus rarus]|uniref:FlaD/FlaE family flagellar protein n=1 Tax=Halobellus rarus TaxID=1126237 RepID=A0ABD6CQC1_9EURY|nr:FlaD/FlaE family flagellar protein [Halobellus rarus]